MLRCNLGFVDLMLWGLVVYLALHVPHIEMRMDDEQALAASKIRQAQQLQAETQTEKLIDPGPKEPRSTCFHMPRSECPTDGRCRHVDPVSVFCCDVDSFRLKEALAISLYQNTTNLHVLNATIDELNISQAMFRRLQSMAVTDGNIGQIVASEFEEEDDGQFPKHSSIACLNISNNNLTSTKLRSTTQRPFAYLFNMTVLDASANNLTEFPLSLVQSNRKISMDLSGNNHLQCSQFSRVMENNSNNASLVTFLNYDKTYCSRTLFTHWWFKEDQVIKIDVLRAQRELNLQCLKIRPIGINCTCTLAANHQSVSVDCSNQNLKEMPTNLPPYTENLNVSHNNISSLQAVGDDPTYEQVVQLSVDYNDIVSIVELEGTNFIDNFRVFGLSYNKLKYIHTYVLSNRFDQRTSQNVPAPLLFIGGNYINCDCNTEKLLKPWLVEYTFNIYDFAHLECKGGLGPVVELTESQVCHTPRDWTDYINFIIGLEVLVLVLLISKVSYDYWVFKTAGYLPWPANKMPRLPCDWLCE